MDPMEVSAVNHKYLINNLFIYSHNFVITFSLMKNVIPSSRKIDTLLYTINPLYSSIYEIGLQVRPKLLLHLMCALKFVNTATIYQ